MCGRFVSPEERALERAFDLGRRDNPNPFARRFNVCPSDTIPFLRMPSNSDQLELATGRWGLVPHWWKQAKPPKLTFNARLEEAPEKAMWRDAWSRSRCLVPAEGWYEWQAVERVDPATGEIVPAKQPHFIRRRDGALLCFAGLMAYWKSPKTGEALRSCAVLTAPAQGTLADIHERAPLVLSPEAYGAWLDRRITDPQEVKRLAARGLPTSELTQWKVRLLVNNARSDGPELIEPVADENETPTSAG